jgi:Ca-activated chloride channel family protein
LASAAATGPAQTLGGGASRAGGLLLLAAALPFVGGWELWRRRDPDAEAGRAALAAGRADEALASFDRAIGRSPDEALLHYDRGTALYALGQLPDAQKAFQRATEAKDAAVRADAYFNLGNTQWRQQRWKEAAEGFKRALALRPEDSRAKWNLELALRRLKQEEEQKQQRDQKQQDQKQQDQQQQDQQQQDQKQRDQKQQDQQQDQQQQDQQQDQKQQGQEKQKQDQQDKKSQDAQKQDAQKQDAQKQDAQKQDAQKQDAQKQDAQKQDAQKQDAQKHAAEQRAIDRQDAELLLQAFEKIDPLLQKELARRRARTRTPPKKDW